MRTCAFTVNYQRISPLAPAQAPFAQHPSAEPHHAPYHCGNVVVVTVHLCILHMCPGPLNKQVASGMEGVPRRLVRNCDLHHIGGRTIGARTILA